MAIESHDCSCSAQPACSLHLTSAPGCVATAIEDLFERSVPKPYGCSFSALSGPISAIEASCWSTRRDVQNWNILIEECCNFSSSFSWQHTSSSFSWQHYSSSFARHLAGIAGNPRYFHIITRRLCGLQKNSEKFQCQREVEIFCKTEESEARCELPSPNPHVQARLDRAKLNFWLAYCYWHSGESAPSRRSLTERRCI